MSVLRAIVRRVSVRLFAGSLPESLAVAGNELLTVAIFEAPEFFAGICEDPGVAKISETGVEAAVFSSVAERLEIETLPSGALSEIRTTASAGIVISLSISRLSGALSEIRTTPGGVALTALTLTIVQHRVSKSPRSEWCVKCFGMALPAEPD